MEFSLRPAEAEDIDFCRNLSKRNMAGYFQKLGIEWDECRFTDSWVELENWVVLANLVPIGCLRLSPRGQALDIRELQVVPESQNQGAATWAIQRVKSMAFGRGFESVGLRVFISNPAQRLYRRLGCMETGRDEKSIHMLAPTT